MTKIHWSGLLSGLANVILLTAMVVSIAQAQTTTAKPATRPTPAPPSGLTSTVTPYTLTELQRAHLHEAQLQFFLVSRDLQKALEDFNRACDDAKAENKWASGVRCNIQDLVIVPPEKK
jgi:hypothetical protein